jgi:hypothetical protein
MLIKETDLRHFLWTDKINVRWKDASNNLHVDAAPECGDTSGKYFEEIQIYSLSHIQTCTDYHQQS